MRFGIASLGILLVVLCILSAGPAATAQNAGNSTGVSGNGSRSDGRGYPGCYGHPSQSRQRI